MLEYYSPTIHPSTTTIKALHRIKGEKAISFIEEQLLTGDEGAIIGAAELLSERCDPRLMEVFKANLDHSSLMVRKPNAIALLWYPDDDAITTAIKVLNDCITSDDRDIRIRCFSSMGSFNFHKDVLSLLATALRYRYEDVRQEAVFFARHIKDIRLVEPLSFVLLNDSNVTNREISAQCLGWIKIEDSVNALINGLNDSEPNVKVQCLNSLAILFKDPSLRVDIVDRLLSLLDINLDQIMAGSCKVLGRLKDVRAIPKLLEIARRGYIVVSGAASKALLEIGDHSIVEELLDVIEQSPQPYAARLLVLSKFGGQMVRNYLLRIARGRDDWMMNRVAISYLGYLNDHTIIDDLLSFLKSDNPLIIEASLKSLAELKYEDIENLLRKYYYIGKGDSSGDTPSYINIIGITRRCPDLCKGLLLEALEDDHVTVRKFAIESLGGLNESDYTITNAIVNHMLKYKENLETIALTMLKIGDESVVEPLFQIYFGEAGDYNSPLQDRKVLKIVRVWRKYSNKDMKEKIMEMYDAADPSVRRRALVAWKAYMHDELTSIK